MPPSLRTFLRWLGRHPIIVIAVCFAFFGWLVADQLAELAKNWLVVGPEKATEIGVAQDRLPEPVPPGTLAPAVVRPPTASAVPPFLRGLHPTPAPEPPPPVARTEPSGSEQPITSFRPPSDDLSMAQPVPRAPAPPPSVAPRSRGVDLGAGKFQFRPLDPAEETFTSSSPPGPTVGEKWEQARRAYWNGARDEAIAIYKELTREYPREPDFFGELGNIYHELGEKELAAQAYYQAALILVEQGENERAERLLGVIEGLSQRLGEELGARLKRI